MRENLSWGGCEQHRRRPAYASAQSDQRLWYSLFLKNHKLATSEISIFLASLCSWGDWFETRFAGNPEDRFSHDRAHIVDFRVFETMLSDAGDCLSVHLPDYCDSSIDEIIQQRKSIYNLTGFDVNMCLG